MSSDFCPARPVTRSELSAPPASSRKGMVPLAPTAATPGICCSRRSRRSRYAARSARVRYFVKFMSICIVRTWSLLKPGSTPVSFSRLRTISPAPMSSTNDAATWATMSARRRSLRWTSLRGPAEIAARRGPSRRDTAGRMAAMMPVSNDTPRVKSSTAVSIRTSVARGVNRPAYCTSRSIPTNASRRPHAPPTRARIRLSVASCRSSRP